jgi:hypothetical protein
VTSQRTDLNFASATCTAPSAAGYACGSLPDIRSKTVQLHLSGGYQIDKQSGVLVGVAYQRLSADDYLYNYYQMGFTGATTMPTNQQTGSYTQYRLMLAYRFAFQ